jgi:hypothetical protein
MKLRLTLLSLALLTSTATPSQNVQDERLALGTETLAALNAEARSHYEAAVESADHRNDTMALEHLVRAVEHSPDTVELQLVLGRFALHVSDGVDMREAQRGLDIARQSYDRALSSDNTSTLESLIARLGLIDVDSRAQEIEARREALSQSRSDYIERRSILNERVYQAIMEARRAWLEKKIHGGGQTNGPSGLLPTGNIG